MSRGIVYTLIFGLLLFLSFNKHSRDKQSSYYNVIWADAAGYYVYNTMWFVYGNNAENFPDSIDVKTGTGFSLDKNKNSVYTKYPCGTAILEAPFFLVSHALAKPFGYKADGFSKIYAYGLYVSGVFYCLFGMLLLIGFLKQHFSQTISITSVIVFFISTNLYFYTIDAPGMSHVYSFFVFSCVIYLTPKLVANFSFFNIFLLFLLIFLAILIRPTNILIGFFPFFFISQEKIGLKQRIFLFLQHRTKKLIAFFLALLIFIPQIIYWKNTSGNFINYGYKNEGFDFWNNPKLLEVWFAANNGLFIYTPLIILSLIGIVVMIKDKNSTGYFIGILFLLISYIFSSWWNWWFGCSFGARSFVEYYALFIIPVCFLWQQIKNKLAHKIMFFTFIAFCCFINLSIEYYYDGCFYGTNTWDYHAFFKLITS